jgi:hypothetical protein
MRNTGNGRPGTVYYVAQETAFAPGISMEWPSVIQAPHTRHGRLVRMSPGECKAIDDAMRREKK